MGITTRKIMLSKHLTISVLLSCPDKPTEPELTEENVARIVAEALAKMADTRHQRAISFP